MTSLLASGCTLLLGVPERANDSGTADVDLPFDGGDADGDSDADAETDAVADVEMPDDLDSDLGDDPDLEPEAGVEGCNDMRDDDGDGLIDCADPDCADEPCGRGCWCAGRERHEISCDDFDDNDGDGETDCHDLDCEAAAACDHRCRPEALLSCEARLDGSNLEGEASLSGYDCSSETSGEAAGREVVYAFETLATGQVEVTLDGEGENDLELFVLRDSAGDCVIGRPALDCSQDDGNDEVVSFEAVAGERYYLIVDGYRWNDAGAFSLVVSCD